MDPTSLVQFRWANQGEARKRHPPINISELERESFLYLDINLRIHFSQIVHYAVKIQLACSQDHVFPRFFHLEAHEQDKLNKTDNRSELHMGCISSWNVQQNMKAQLNLLG